MKKARQAILYNLILILIFFMIYSLLSDHFIGNNNKTATTIDFLNLSITLQATIGNTFITPTTFFSKFLVTLQQFLLIFGNLFILHL